jgi:alpha-ketoglutarate-dependent taurine dioxygenase
VKSFDALIQATQRASASGIAAQRSPVPLSVDGLVDIHPMSSHPCSPIVVQSVVPDINPVAWAEQARHKVSSLLLQDGAVLFRGFPLVSATDFARFTDAICGGRIAYTERSSPRTEVGNNVYTSTDYPKDRTILPHNEHSYSAEFPRKLLFFCETPADSGGETPIVSTRKVLHNIEPEIMAKFAAKGWMYVRNFHPGLGLSWKDAFQTEDRDAVDEYCHRACIQVEWNKNESLRTHQIRPVLITHPDTHEQIWFNHATFFNAHCIPQDIRMSLLNEFGAEGLPHNTYYGDGEAIDEPTIRHLQAAYEQELFEFRWVSGDVLLLDNILTAHARNQFSGARKILCAMCDPYTRTDLPKGITEKTQWASRQPH